MLTAARNHLMQWHLPLIHPLVLTSVLACQRLANYRSCQNNYWERKTNFPFNHFSPYSTSPLTPCLTAFYSNGPRTFGKVILGDLNRYSLPEMVPMGNPHAAGPPGLLRVRAKLNMARGGCFRGLQSPRGKNEIKYSPGSLITIRTIIQLGIQEKTFIKYQIQLFLRKGNRKLYLVTLVTSNKIETHTHISFLFMGS